MVCAPLAVWMDITGHCLYGTTYTADYAMICQHGGLTFVCHNDLYGILQLSCFQMFVIVLLLSHLSVEKYLLLDPASRQDDTRVDIHAHGFCAFLI